MTSRCVGCKQPVGLWGEGRRWHLRCRDQLVDVWTELLVPLGQILSCWNLLLGSGKGRYKQRYAQNSRKDPTSGSIF